MALMASGAVQETPGYPMPVFFFSGPGTAPTTRYRVLDASRFRNVHGMATATTRSSSPEGDADEALNGIEEQYEKVHLFSFARS
jgi:hypothetical protein